MNRFLQYFNLLGVLALAALCTLQWRTNSRLEHQVRDLRQTQRQLTDTLAQRNQRIAQDTEDLDDFRRRISLAETELADQEKKLAFAVLLSNQLASERGALLARQDQLKAALATWQAAVVARDAALAKAVDEIKTLAAQRDQAVQQFNDLATKYNAVVKDLNTAHSKPFP